MEKGIKICMLCQKKIRLNKDNYVKVEDYRLGKFYTGGYYHNKCYLDRINKSTPMQKVALELAQRANNLLNQVEGDKVIDIV